MFEPLPTIPCSEKVLDYVCEKFIADRWLSLRGTDNFYSRVLNAFKKA